MRSHTPSSLDGNASIVWSGAKTFLLGTYMNKDQVPVEHRAMCTQLSTTILPVAEYRCGLGRVGFACAHLGMPMRLSSGMSFVWPYQPEPCVLADVPCAPRGLIAAGWLRRFAVGALCSALLARFVARSVRLYFSSIGWLRGHIQGAKNPRTTNKNSTYVKFLLHVRGIFAPLKSLLNLFI